MSPGVSTETPRYQVYSRLYTGKVILMWYETVDQSLLRDSLRAAQATYKMMRYLFIYRIRVALYAILTCALCISPLVSPRLVQFLLDKVYPARDLVLLAWVSAGLFLLTILTSVCWVGATYLSTYLSNMIRSRLTIRVFYAIYSLPLTTIEEQSKGAFIQRAQQDVASVAFSLTSVLSRLISFVFTFLVALGIIFTINIKLSLAVLVIIPLNYAIVIFMSRALRRVGLRSRQVAEQVSSFSEETITGIRELKVFNFARTRSQKLRKHLRDLVKLNFAEWRISTFWGQVNSLVATIWGVLILFLGGYLVFTDRLQLGQAVALGMYIEVLLRPFGWLSEAYGMIMNISISSERVLTILNEAEKTKKLEKLPALLERVHSIEFQDVWFSYEQVNGPTTKYALSNVSFVVEKGTTIAVIGPNGSGKSTLLRLLSGFDDRYKGTILIGNQDLREISPRSYLKEISCSWQNTFFFNDLLRLNISALEGEEDPDKLHEYVAMLEIEDLVESLPNGWDTLVGSEGTTFSGGQEQILGLARALAKPCSLLLLDEPTTHIDTERHDRLLKRVLEHKKKDCTTFLVTHDMDIVAQPLVDRVIKLSAGHIVSDVVGSQKMASF